MKRFLVAIVISIFGLSVSYPALVLATPLSENQKKALKSGVYYYNTEINNPDQSCGTGGGSTTLTGGDNPQKAYNYFRGKGLSPTASAAIVGNLIVESSVNPGTQQGGGGPGMGIAQWTRTERWTVLMAFAEGPPKRDPFDLATQLDFMWEELQGKPPLGGYRQALENTKKQSNIADATGFFMGTSAVRDADPAAAAFISKYGRVGGYENPGTPHLDRRIEAAKKILASNGESDTSVSGLDASCAAGGNVNCTPGNQSATGNLSAVRQNVVCLANAEYDLWEKGQLKTGGSEPYAFYKYSQGRNEEWCADFASWIYNKAGYPISTAAKEGNVPAVQSIWDIGRAGGRFEYHDKGGYIPKPGDLVIYKNGVSHVNIVVSVNVAKKTMVTIGGNESGTSSANQTSRVQKASEQSITSANGLTGFVSPTK